MEKVRTEMKLTIETYRDKAGEHRWRAKSDNGRIVAVSGEGYKNKADMLSTIHALQFDFEYAKLVEVDGE